MDVRSEPGVIPKREPFTMSIHKSPVQAQQPPVQNMRLAFTSDGTAIYKPVATGTSSPYQSGINEGRVGSNGGGGNAAADDDGPAQAPFDSHGLNINMEEQMKQKREQLRKYGPDGPMALALSPVTQASAGAPVCGGFSSPLTGSEKPASSHSVKKARGRPPGSGNKQKMAPIGSAGTRFTAHVITVKTGEDVSSNIMSFSQCGSRAVCILSANGAISNVTLRQPSTYGGTVTYEGRFEILSLSGSFLLTENGGQRSRTGGLSVSLAGPDGRVLGGGVAGILTAASPVQVVIGSFIADDPKESNSPNGSGPPTSVTRLPFGGATGASSPHSHGTLSESSGGPNSPVNYSSGACNNMNQQSVTHMQWK